jgi:hypothetical protein
MGVSVGRGAGVSGSGSLFADTKVSVPSALDAESVNVLVGCGAFAEFKHPVVLMNSRRMEIKFRCFKGRFCLSMIIKG